MEHWKSSGVPSQPGTQGASGYLGFRFVGSDVYSFEQPDLTFVGFCPQFSEMKLLGLGGAHIMTIFNNIDNWHWPCLHCEWMGSSASAHEHSNSWVACAADKVVCVQNTHAVFRVVGASCATVIGDNRERFDCEHLYHARGECESKNRAAAKKIVLGLLVSKLTRMFLCRNNPRGFYNQASVCHATRKAFKIQLQIISDKFNVEASCQQR